MPPRELRKPKTRLEALRLMDGTPYHKEFLEIATADEAKGIDQETAYINAASFFVEANPEWSFAQWNIVDFFDERLMGGGVPHGTADGVAIIPGAGEMEVGEIDDEFMEPPSNEPVKPPTLISKEQFNDTKVPMADIVEWVAQRLDLEEVAPEDAPNSAAYSMWLQYRWDVGRKDKFYAMWSKHLTARKDLGDAPTVGSTGGGGVHATIRDFHAARQAAQRAKT